MDRARIDELTARWRRRHEARRPADDRRPAASAEREDLAARAFPWTAVTPAAYVAEHGRAMTGFTYDHERYADPGLDAWLLEVGRLLRAERDASR